jgi:hypothetical protein
LLSLFLSIFFSLPYLAMPPRKKVKHEETNGSSSSSDPPIALVPVGGTTSTSVAAWKSRAQNTLTASSFGDQAVTDVTALIIAYWNYHTLTITGYIVVHCPTASQRVVVLDVNELWFDEYTIARALHARLPYLYDFREKAERDMVDAQHAQYKGGHGTRGPAAGNRYLLNSEPPNGPIWKRYCAASYFQEDAKRIARVDAVISYRELATGIAFATLFTKKQTSRHAFAVREFCRIMPILTIQSRCRRCSSSMPASSVSVHVDDRDSDNKVARIRDRRCISYRYDDCSSVVAQELQGDPPPLFANVEIRQIDSGELLALVRIRVEPDPLPTWTLVQSERETKGINVHCFSVGDILTMLWNTADTDADDDGNEFLRVPSLLSHLELFDEVDSDRSCDQCRRFSSV